MTKQEMRLLYQAIKKNAPEWFARITKKLEQKRIIISSCIDIASTRKGLDYQDEINKVYNSVRCPLNERETIILNYICLVKHKELLNNDIVKDDVEIRKWLGILQEYISSPKEPVLDLLNKHTRQIIEQYKIKNDPGRPKGSGKRVYTYNGKEYHTLQECADDYGITRQGMFKRLKKLSVI